MNKISPKEATLYITSIMVLPMSIIVLNAGNASPAIPKTKTATRNIGIEKKKISIFVSSQIEDLILYPLAEINRLYSSPSCDFTGMHIDLLYIAFFTAPPLGGFCPRGGGRKTKTLCRTMPTQRKKRKLLDATRAQEYNGKNRPLQKGRNVVSYSMRCGRMAVV